MERRQSLPPDPAVPHWNLLGKLRLRSPCTLAWTWVPSVTPPDSLETRGFRLKWGIALCREEVSPRPHPWPFRSLPSHRKEFQEETSSGVKQISLRGFAEVEGGRDSAEQWRASPKAGRDPTHLGIRYEIMHLERRDMGDTCARAPHALGHDTWTQAEHGLRQHMCVLSLFYLTFICFPQAVSRGASH